MIVAKVGGALLSNAEGVARACALIRSLPTPLLVVVSAMRGVTRELEAVARAGAAGLPEAGAKMAEILDRHERVAAQLLGPAGQRAWHEATEPERTRLTEVIRGLAIVRELSPRTLDLVEHVGERLASALVASVLAEAECVTERVSALDIVITDTAHRFARPDTELTRERAHERLSAPLAQGRVVVTEGYIARGVDGSITTMGRESSDYSATLLGALLGAHEVRIYTGVEGVMTADPAVVPEAQTIERMSYGMANALAEAGAQLLHPRTVLPVRESGIPLSICSLDGGGTTISAQGGGEGWSIALNRHAELLLVETSTVGVQLDAFLHAISARAPLAWHHRFRRRSHLVLAQPFPDSQLPLDQLPEPATALSRRTVALVSIVSERPPTSGLLGRALLLLESEGVAVYAVQDAIDEHAVSLAVEPEAGERAIRLLHSAMPALAGARQ